MAKTHDEAQAIRHDLRNAAQVLVDLKNILDRPTPAVDAIARKPFEADALAALVLLVDRGYTVDEVRFAFDWIGRERKMF